MRARDSWLARLRPASDPARSTPVGTSWARQILVLALFSPVRFILGNHGPAALSVEPHPGAGKCRGRRRLGLGSERLELASPVDLEPWMLVPTACPWGTLGCPQLSYCGGLIRSQWGR